MINQTLLDIMDEWSNKYLHQRTGLTRLSENEGVTPNGWEPTNDNPLLFTAEIVAQSTKLMGTPTASAERAMRRAIETLRNDNGTMNKKYLDWKTPNTHDNKVGELAGALSVGMLDFISEQYQIIMNNFYSYNNVHPYQWTLETFLLPRDVALFQAALGLPMGPVARTHLKLQIFTSSKHKRLNKLRMEILRMAVERHMRDDAADCFNHYVTWWKSWGGDQRFYMECCEYYGKDYPYTKLAKLEANEK